MSKIHVIPAPGLLVPVPPGPESNITARNLPPDGMEVDASDIYWMRRLRDGDVTIAAPAKSTPKKGDA